MPTIITGHDFKRLADVIREHNKKQATKFMPIHLHSLANYLEKRFRAFDRQAWLAHIWKDDADKDSKLATKVVFKNNQGRLERVEIPRLSE